MSSTPNEQGHFLARVSEIPLVKAFCQTVASTYETTKNSNRFVGATLEKAEGYAKFANEQAEPLKKFLDRPLSTVSQIADKQLEALQNRFPAINTTPNEIVQYGQNLYQRTGIKRRVEEVAAAKENSVEKITGTSVYFRNRIVGSTNRVVSSALDYSENFIDRFVASPKKRDNNCASTSSSYKDRVLCISNKLVDGATYRVTITYDNVKGKSIQGFNAADKLLKDATASVSASVQKTISDAARIREVVSNEIAARSRAITAKSESVAVSLTKTLSNGVANISDRVVTSAAPFLPEGMEKPVAALASYAHHWQERVAKASSAGDIWRTAADETRQNLLLAKGLIESILNNKETHVADNKRW